MTESKDETKKEYPYFDAYQNPSKRIRILGGDLAGDQTILVEYEDGIRKRISKSAIRTKP